MHIRPLTFCNPTIYSEHTDTNSKKKNPPAKLPSSLKSKTMAIAEAYRHDDVMKLIDHHMAAIENYAGKFDVNPDLIRAIIYEEQTHLGMTEGFREKYLGMGNTVGLGQMTVGMYGRSRRELLNPAINIQTIAEHLQILQNQYGNDIAVLASYYNCGSCTSTTDYGHRVMGYYNNFTNH